MANQIDANEEFVAPQDETTAPSAEETQQPEGTETGTPQQPEAKAEESVPFDKHPGWVAYRERQKAREEALAEQNRQLLEILKAKEQGRPVEPTLGNTPEEREFYGQVRELSRREAQALLKAKEDEFRKALEVQQKIIGNLLTSNFRQKYPDVKKGSEEEFLISQKIGMGYDADDAYKTVMFDKVAKTAQEKAQTQTRQQLQAKRQANVESTSPPSISGLPKSKETLRQTAARLLAEAEAAGGLEL